MRQALADAADNSGSVAPGAGDELRRQLAGLSVAEQDRVLTGLVRSEAADRAAASLPRCGGSGPGIQ